MNRIKMSIAALALVLTVGAAVATNAKAPNDCALTPNSPTGTLDSQASCPAPQEVFCCYLINSSTQILKRP